MAQEIQMGHCKLEKDGITCPLYYKYVNFLLLPLLVGKTVKWQTILVCLTIQGLNTLYLWGHAHILQIQYCVQIVIC